jgi:hypothetical protein
MDNVSELGNLAMWSLIVGFVSPIAISLLQQPTWSSQVRAVVAFLFSAVLAVPTAYFAGDLQGKDLVTSGLLIVVSAMSAYRNFWKPTGVSPTVEAATSPSSSKDAPYTPRPRNTPGGSGPGDGL